MQCSFGAAPGSLVVLLANRVMTQMPEANIMDNKLNLNVPLWIVGAPTVLIANMPALSSRSKLCASEEA